MHTPTHRTRQYGVIGTFAALAVAIAAPAGAQQGVVRKVLTRHDLPTPGYEVVLVEGTIAPGGREGRHTHPGTLLIYVAEGPLRLERDGKPPVTLQTGETIAVDPGEIHEGVNPGSGTVRLLATFVVEKGKPITSQVPPQQK